MADLDPNPAADHGVTANTSKFDGNPNLGDAHPPMETVTFKLGGTQIGTARSSAANVARTTDEDAGPGASSVDLSAAWSLHVQRRFDTTLEVDYDVGKQLPQRLTPERLRD